MYNSVVGPVFSTGGIMLSLFPLVFRHLLFIFQALQEAFTRCVNVLGSSSKPEELSVQVIIPFSYHSNQIGQEMVPYEHILSLC
jgi:hypothetical protein